MLRLVPAFASVAALPEGWWVALEHDATSATLPELGIVATRSCKERKEGKGGGGAGKIPTPILALVLVLGNSSGKAGLGSHSQTSAGAVESGAGWNRGSWSCWELSALTPLCAKSPHWDPLQYSSHLEFKLELLGSFWLLPFRFYHLLAVLGDSLRRGGWKEVGNEQLE